MCKKSTKVIHGYLTKLIGSDSCINFTNTNLNVLIPPLESSELEKREVLSNQENTFRKRQRITKEQRCSLLKQLLTPNQKLKKERDKIFYSQSGGDYEKGGLKNIINFTKNYDFSLCLDKNSNVEITPLERLKAFSTNYFRRNFDEFRESVLCVIDSQYDEESSDDGNTVDEAILKFEEVIIEPDIKIKCELSDCESQETQYACDYVETMYEEDVKIKTEEPDLSVSHYNSGQEDRGRVTSGSVNLLDKLVSSYPYCKKVFSRSNVRCRTRNHPYINPTLKDQFLFQCFKCDKCNRYFKSQGYLKAHSSKVH
ncbi:uncharacterized protein LOC132696611 isoform X2 [Cylas formicarius]|nr:uncharacterized protein LOC132696611 isoform X2 [Cylas formicarius]